jgi:catechol 2,3-dioxygenase-like lactoylglutathione lyase family enzyme
MFSTELAEIVLIVEDVERSARFYRDVVGLVPENEPEDGWAWFWAGEPGQAQRVALHKGTLLFEERSPLPEGERWGRVHYAFNVPREKLEEAADHVRQKGHTVYGPVYLAWMKALSYYFYDPNGNLLEFWSPDPGGDDNEG